VRAQFVRQERVRWLCVDFGYPFPDKTDIAEMGIQTLELAAFTAIALADESRDRLARSHLLPAQVDIALAGGDLDEARAAVDELEAIACVYRSPVIEAVAPCAHGQLQLRVGDAAEARRNWRAGCRLWQELDAPYESPGPDALAVAHRAVGDLETADLESAAARLAFE
jgi:hypothetical protein